MTSKVGLIRKTLPCEYLEIGACPIICTDSLGLQYLLVNEPPVLLLAPIVEQKASESDWLSALC